MLWHLAAKKHHRYFLAARAVSYRMFIYWDVIIMVWVSLSCLVSPHCGHSLLSFSQPQPASRQTYHVWAALLCSRSMCSVISTSSPTVGYPLADVCLIDTGATVGARFPALRLLLLLERLAPPFLTLAGDFLHGCPICIRFDRILRHVSANFNEIGPGE